MTTQTNNLTRYELRYTPPLRGQQSILDAVIAQNADEAKAAMRLRLEALGIIAAKTAIAIEAERNWLAGEMDVMLTTVSRDYPFVNFTTMWNEADTFVEAEFTVDRRERGTDAVTDLVYRYLSEIERRVSPHFVRSDYHEYWLRASAHFTVAWERPYPQGGQA